MVASARERGLWRRPAQAGMGRTLRLLPVGLRLQHAGAGPADRDLALARIGEAADARARAGGVLLVLAEGSAVAAGAVVGEGPAVGVAGAGGGAGAAEA